MDARSGLGNKMECVWCNLPIQIQLHVYVIFPICNHSMHEECRDTARFIHHISGCPGCNSTRIPILDLGDDALVRRAARSLLFEQRSKQIVEAGAFRPSEIRVHCQEMFQKRMDAARKAQSNATAMESGGGIGGLMGIFRKSSAPASAPAAGSMNPVSDSNLNLKFNAHEINWKLAQDFALVHHNIEEFHENNLSVVDLYDAGVTIQQMRNASYTLKELHELGFTWEHLVVMGLQWKDLMCGFKYPSRDLRDLYGVTYKTIIDFASGKGDSALGVERFCQFLLGYDELVILEMTDIRFLIQLGMRKRDFYNLSQSVSLQDFINLKITLEQLEKLDVLNYESWKIMQWGDPKEVMDALAIPYSRMTKNSSPADASAPAGAAASQAPKEKKTQIRYRVDADDDLVEQAVETLYSRMNK